jgi:hypothetical protein
MKKLLLLLVAAACAYSSFAQTISGADMETWRTSSSGAGHPRSVTAPKGWYGDDSVIIGLGQTFGNLILMTNDSAWQRNLFREDTIVHSGNHSAKVMTMAQDTILIPGILTTAQTHVGITFTPPYITGITLSGGNPVSARPTSVSAWVQYYAGKDSTGATGIDSGTLNVQALAHIGSRDSVIGVGTMTIAPTSTWTQITVSVSYTDTTYAIDTMRIALSSSKVSTALDSSTLYVDDVTMTSVPNPDHTGIGTVSSGGQVCVSVRPATRSIFVTSPVAEGLEINVYTADGRLVATRQLTGSDVIDMSSLAPAAYFYAVTDRGGRLLARGKALLAP